VSIILLKTEPPCHNANLPDPNNSLITLSKLRSSDSASLILNWQRSEHIIL